MAKIKWLTAGESHGKGIVGIIEGIPANLEIDKYLLQHELRRRQKGYGRGGRMQIESDAVEIISGIRFGKTIGSPITVFIENKDWQNWHDVMAVFDRNELSSPPISMPRPGHADLAGSIKYNQNDIRNIIERASARETAVRVALGAIAKQLLNFFNIKIFSQVIQIKQVKTNLKLLEIINRNFDDYLKRIEDSKLHCGDPPIEKAMMKTIDDANTKGDSIGGRFEVLALNVPVGLGSYIQWNRRLDGLIAQAFMSIPAIKAVEIGIGRDYAEYYGSAVHDEIFWDDKNKSCYHKTNNSGGIEGGISNGEAIAVTATMKPIPTLKTPLQSIDLRTKQAVLAHKERSDVCAVPAAAIIGEAMLSLTLADQLCEKLGGDSIEEMKIHFNKLNDN